MTMVQCRDAVYQMGAESDQWPRTLESYGRHVALTVLEVLRQAGESVASIARRLCVSLRTLQRWASKNARGWLVPRNLGRPRQAIDERDRKCIESWLERTHGRIGVDAMKATHPKAPRSMIRAIKSSWLGQHCRSKRRSQAQLEWRVPGASWSMDFSKPQQRMAGRDRRVFVVRDLSSGAVLAAVACVGERAEVAVHVLKRLFREVGVPLVIKHDNGSAFRSHAVQDLLNAMNVLCLPSPPGLPQYNGAVESGMGPLKAYALASAETHGHPDLLTPVDLEHAVEVWNNQPVHRDSEWRTRAAIHGKRPATLERRRRRLLRAYKARFTEAAERLGLDPTAPMEWWDKGKVVRASLPDALVELGFLWIREGDFDR